LAFWKLEAVHLTRLNDGTQQESANNNEKHFEDIKAWRDQEVAGVHKSLSGIEKRLSVSSPSARIIVFLA